MTTSIGRLEGVLGVKLRRIQIHLTRLFDQSAQSFEMRTGTLSALGIIEANPGISQGEVAAQVGQDASAAAQLIDDLEKRGWIARERLSHNRRRYAICITEQGSAVLDVLTNKAAAAEQDLLATLNAQEIIVFSAILSKIYAGVVDRNRQSSVVERQNSDLRT